MPESIAPKPEPSPIHIYLSNATGGISSLLVTGLVSGGVAIWRIAEGANWGNVVAATLLAIALTASFTSLAAAVIQAIRLQMAVNRMKRETNTDESVQEFYAFTTRYAELSTSLFDPLRRAVYITLIVLLLYDRLPW